MGSKRKENVISVRPEVFIILALSALLLPLGWIVAWITAAAVHELFHYCALKICRCNITSIQIGANGTVMDTSPMSYGAEAICAFAGPLAGFLLLFTARWFPVVAICGFIQSTYNLFPIFPMDGGRILRCAMQKWFDLPVADRICLWTERVFLCVVACLCLYLSLVYSLGPIPVIWIAILIIKNKFVNRPCKDRLLRVQ